MLHTPYLFHLVIPTTLSEPKPTQSPLADRAFTLAARAWGVTDAPAFRARLGPAWQARLVEESSAGAPSEALAALRDLHEALARPGPGQVHPSWLVRALAGESPSVRRAVVLTRPPGGPLRQELASALELDESDLRPDHLPHPEVLAWLRGAWTERIVGGLPVSPDDPVVVACLAGLDSRPLLRWLALVGLVKWAVVPEGSLAGAPVIPARQRPRLDRFRRLWGEPDPGWVQVAREDLATHGGDGSTRALIRLAWISVGRALAAVEPQRARWALQHVPYPAVRALRPLVTLDHPQMPADRLLAWEERTLSMAREALDTEGGPPAP